MRLSNPKTSFRGQTALEYLLLVAIVAVVVLGGFKFLVPNVQHSSEDYYNKTTRAIMGENPNPIDGGWCPAQCPPAGSCGPDFVYKSCACPQPAFGGAFCTDSAVEMCPGRQPCTPCTPEIESTVTGPGGRVINILKCNAPTPGCGQTSEMESLPSDMEPMVQSVFQELTTPENRPRIEFHLGALPPVTGDPILLRQVWTNLISNAIKFSAKRDRPRIDVEFQSTVEEDIFSVRDNGAGFDMQYADRLFGVFQRLHTTAEFEGIGVGLAIVQRIIRRHGGRVWAEGKPDKGAAFYFSLPKNKSEDHGPAPE